MRRCQTVLFDLALQPQLVRDAVFKRVVHHENPPRGLRALRDAMRAYGRAGATSASVDCRMKHVRAKGIRPSITGVKRNLAKSRLAVPPVAKLAGGIWAQICKVVYVSVSSRSSPSWGCAVPWCISPPAAKGTLAACRWPDGGTIASPHPISATHTQKGPGKSPAEALRSPVVAGASS